MAARRVLVLGARGLVGERLVSQLLYAGAEVFAATRGTPPPSRERLTWVSSDLRGMQPALDVPGGCDTAISVLGIWLLPQYFTRLQALGVKRVVSISSTSRFTKTRSGSAKEREVVRLLEEGEEQLRRWADAAGIEYVILRPTLIYGDGRDQNIAHMAQFIRKFGFFPVIGAASGRRQPIHAKDVAGACLAAAMADTLPVREFQIAGDEVLPYHEMVARVFQAMGKKPRIVRVPQGLFHTAIRCARLLPRFRHFTPDMANRMAADMVFDTSDARAVLGHAPRRFSLESSDLPWNVGEADAAGPRAR